MGNPAYARNTQRTTGSPVPQYRSNTVSCVAAAEKPAREKRTAVIHRIVPAAQSHSESAPRSLTVPDYQNLDDRELIGELCERVIAQIFDVPLSGLRSRSRNIAEIAFARQTAMYLMSTLCGFSISEVSIYFNRHISTVSHACALVEDKRDSSEFDLKLSEVEDFIRSIESIPDFLAQLAKTQTAPNVLAGYPECRSSGAI